LKSCRRPTALNKTSKPTRSYERQKADLVEFQKALLDNLKGDGFDTKVFKKIVSLRRKNPDDLEEEAAILQTYMSALEIEIKGVIA
jgi:uncharacterized protein (UPF0335 family)